MALCSGGGDGNDNTGKALITVMAEDRNGETFSIYLASSSSFQYTIPKTYIVKINKALLPLLNMCECVFNCLFAIATSVCLCSFIVFLLVSAHSLTSWDFLLVFICMMWFFFSFFQATQYSHPVCSRVKLA